MLEEIDHDGLMKMFEDLNSQLEEQERPLKEWLKKQLGDKYSDDLDLIIMPYVKGEVCEDTQIGRYKIVFTKYTDKVLALNKNLTMFSPFRGLLMPNPNNT